MTKPTIGIIARNEIINNKLYQVIADNNLKFLKECNCIGLLCSNKKNIDKEILRLCDGIIIPGGTDIYDYHFDIIKYCLKNNTPLLGICMGHQIIGLYNNSNNKLIPIDNHYNTSNDHLIKLKKNSNLNKIFGNYIAVNSRHLFKLSSVPKPFKIVAVSNDKTIEAIEYINNNVFILGVQWHPEDMDNMSRLYEYFIDEIKKRKKT